MRNSIRSAIVLAALAAPVAAQDIRPGTYDVQGIENNGKDSYSDVEVLTVTAEGDCRFDFGSPPDVLEGICVLGEGWFAASSVIAGHWTGLYRVTGEGRLEGTWRIEGEAGLGREVLTLRP